MINKCIIIYRCHQWSNRPDPQSNHVEITIFTSKLLCFVRFWKVGTDRGHVLNMNWLWLWVGRVDQFCSNFCCIIFQVWWQYRITFLITQLRKSVTASTNEHGYQSTGHDCQVYRLLIHRADSRTAGSVHCFHIVFLVMNEADPQWSLFSYVVSVRPSVLSPMGTNHFLKSRKTSKF